MRNSGLDKVQAGIKIARRNINNRYADDITRMAESDEKLKSLMMKVKEENGKVGLKLSIQKTKIMASSPITSWQIDGETVVGLISLQSKGLSRVFSNTTVQKHQFFGAQLSLWSNSHIQTWLLEKP